MAEYSRSGWWNGMVNMPSLTVIEASVGAWVARYFLARASSRSFTSAAAARQSAPPGLSYSASTCLRNSFIAAFRWSLEAAWGPGTRGRARGPGGQRAGPDTGGRAGGAVGALHPAADLVPVLVEEHHHRDGLVAVVEEGVAQVRHLIAEEHPELGAGYRLDDVGDQGRVAVHVAAPVLGEHHHVFDPGRPGEELMLLVGELGVGVVLLGPGPGVAHLGHVVLPGQPGGKALRVEGNRQLSHVVLASVRVLGWVLRLTVDCRGFGSPFHRGEEDDLGAVVQGGVAGGQLAVYRGGQVDGRVDPQGSHQVVQSGDSTD